MSVDPDDSLAKILEARESVESVVDGPLDPDDSLAKILEGQ